MKRVLITMMIIVFAWSLHAGSNLFNTGAFIQATGNISLSATIVDVSIPGGNDGSIDLTVSGGVAPYSYLWSNGASSEDIAGLTAGFYSVTVTDALANSALGSWEVTEPGPLNLTASTNPVSCNGMSDGSIDLTVSGGVVPYSYLWSNGSSSEDLTLLPAGNYSVTVTDALLYAAYGTWIVTEPDLLAITANVTPVSCFGGSDGSIDITVEGGTIPYSYIWSNGVTSEDVSNLPAGIYSVVVTDAVGCALSQSYFVLQPDALSINVDNIIQTCPGTAQGAIEISVSGGVYPYAYLWSNGATSEDITNLPAGTYTIVVTDSYNCNETETVLLESYPAPLAVITPSGPTTICQGNSVTLTASGGISYLWSTGVSTPSITVSSSGTYSVTVTDANGCTDTESRSVIVHPLPNASIVPGGPLAFCQGGSVVLTATGGVSYSWSTGATTAAITVASVGTYTVTVTSSAGCTDTESATVTIYPLPTAVITPNGPTTFCAGGSVVLTATGGTSYAWSNGSTNAAITVTTSGIYTVTVTNANGCSDTESVTVNANQAPTAVITPGGPTTFCQGGSVVLTASGGAGFLWSNGATTASITALTSGIYSVTVTNGVGCNDSESITVTVNPLPVAVITPSGPITFCQGGSVTLTASGGSTYKWSTGPTTPAISVTASGTYTVTVTNNNGCTDTESRTVTVNPLPNAVITPGGPTTFCQGGSVILTASGGTTYSWSTGSTAAAITATTTGTYTVTVTNSNGCSKTQSATVTVNPLPVAVITPSGPTTFCQGGSVTLAASGGVSYAWSTGSTAGSIAVTTSGNYTVTVTNNNGCKDTESVTTTVNPLPVAVITPGGPTTFCQGGSVTLTASGGTSFAWSTGASTSSISVSSTGTYTVTVTNSNGCTDTESKSVTVNPLPVVTVTPGGPTTFCQGGSVTLTASGGTSYSWSTGQTTAAITVNTTGNYTVTVTNSNGCSNSKTTAVTVNPLPVAVITPSGPTTFCQGGSVGLTASGGVAYSWSTGSTAQTISVTTGGIYTVTVTNNNNCTDTASISITTIPNPVAVITPGGPTTFCQGGSVTLTASGGSSYKWSTGPATAAITVNASGTYTVTVTNASGCTDTESAVVTVNPLPVAVITAGGPTTFCQGGSVSLTASGGATYAWSNGSTAQTITVSASGNYTVTVTNANGCSDTESVTVTHLPNPVATITPGGPTTFCQGGSVILTASGGSTYKWSTGPTTASITVTSSGSYTVTVTNSSGCTDTESVAVTVNPLPVAVITPGGPTTFCQGGTVTLTASGGTSFVWSNSSTTSNITVNNAGTYTVTVTNANGCKDTESVTTTVNPLPVAVITAGGPTTFCQGGSVTLTASGGTTYAWSNGSTSASLTATAAGIYTVTVTNSYGCTDTESVAVTVNPLPTAVVTPGGPTTFCQGGSVTLTASGGTGYSWSTGSTAAAITVSASGNYVVTVTNSNGCSSSKTTAVTVNPLPVVVINSNGPTTFCQGGSVTLTASGGSTYLWSTGATGASITVSSAGVYAVTATNSNGCLNTQTATVNVLPQPSATITAMGPTTFCEGGAVALVASGGASYLWSNGSTGSTIWVTTSGTYSVTPTSGQGCAGIAASQAVQVKPRPTVTNSQPSPVCSGAGFNLALTSSVAGSTFTWTASCSPAGSVTGYTATQAAPVVMINDNPVNTTSGFATVTYVITPYANGCNGPAKSITVLVKPTPQLTTAPPAPVCSGTVFYQTLSATIPGSMFTWNAACTPSGSVTGYTASQTVPVTAINNLLVNTTSSTAVVQYQITPVFNGCAGPAGTLPVSVNQKPYLTTPTPAPVCSGELFHQDLSASQPGSTFIWTATCNPPGAVTGFTASQTTPVTEINDILMNLTTTLATVTYHITPLAGGCTGSQSDLTVTVKPVPSIIVPAPGSMCSGTVFAQPLTSTIPGTGFTWTATCNPAGAVSGFTAVQSTPVVLIFDLLVNNTTAAATVTYHVTPEADGCAGAPADITITVNPVPISTTPLPAPVCSGTALNLPLTATIPGTLFTWTAIAYPPGTVTGFTASQSTPVALINDVLTNVSANYGMVVYEITPVVNGCSGPSEEILVLVRPVPVLTMPAPVQVCSGNYFTQPLTSPVAGTSFTWTATCSPAGAVTGFTASQTIPVTSINDLLTNITGSPATVTYHITPEANGCTGPVAHLSVTVKHFPDVSITPSGPTTFCQGGSVTLTAAGGTSYLWSTGATTPAITVSESGTYTVTVTDVYGCTASTSATVTVIPLLPVSLTITADANPVYVGTVVTFTATPVNGGITPVYQWKVNGTNTGTNAPIFSYLPVNGDVVVCYLTSSAQCPTPVPAVSNSIAMVVNPLPFVEVFSPNGGEDWVRGTNHEITWSDNIDATVNITLYKGGVFHSNIALGESSDGSYQWSIPPTQTPGTDYKVKITSTVNTSLTDESNGNFTISTGINAYDSVKNVVVASGQTMCFNATNTLTVAGNGTTFQVQSGGSATLIAGQKISFLPGTRIYSGGYMHGYISTVFCGGVTVPMVSTIAGEEENNMVLTRSGYLLYPNPTPGSFTIEPKDGKTEGINRIEVLDMRGTIITSGTLCNDCPNRFTIADAPSGLYFVRILAGEKPEVIKLIKGARE